MCNIMWIYYIIHNINKMPWPPNSPDMNPVEKLVHATSPPTGTRGPTVDIMVPDNP